MTFVTWLINPMSIVWISLSIFLVILILLMAISDACRKCNIRHVVHERIIRVNMDSDDIFSLVYINKK